MVRNAAPLVKRQLGGADVEMAVDLQRVAVDDFAVEPLRDFQRQIAFSGAGGAGHCNQREFHYVCNDERTGGEESHGMGCSHVCIETPLYNINVIFGLLRPPSGRKKESRNS